MGSKQPLTLDMIREKIKSEDILKEAQILCLSKNAIQNIITDIHRNEKRQRLLNFIFSSLGAEKCIDLFWSEDNWVEELIHEPFLFCDKVAIPLEIQKILLSKDEDPDYSGYEDYRFVNLAENQQFSMREMIEKRLTTTNGYLLLHDMKTDDLNEKLYQAFYDFEKDLINRISDEHLDFLLTLAKHISRGMPHLMTRDGSRHGFEVTGFILTGLTEYELYSESFDS